MAEELISQYVDRGAIKDDTDFLLKNLDAVYQQFVKLNKLKVGIDNDKSFKEVAESIKKVKKEEDELLRMQAQIEATYKKRIALESEQAKILAEEKELLRQRNAEIKNQVRENNAAEGSIEKLRATLIKLNKEYDNLSKADREASQGQGLKTQIQELDAELKKLEGETGRFQRNVGNYKSAFGDAFKTLTKELDNIKNKLSDPSLSGQQLQSLRNQEQLLSDVLEGVSANFSSTRQEAKAFQEAAARIGLTLGQQSQIFQEFRKEVGGAVDDIADIKDSIKLAASDTQGFDRLLNAATGLTGAFSVAQGAAALFGAENEELQATMVKLQAAMTILNGLQAIQNELKNKDSVFRKAINFLTATETKLTQQRTAAQVASNAATEAGTKATKGLGTALKGIGIGLILSLIPVLTKAAELFDGISNSQEDNLSKAQQNVEAEQARLDILNDSDNVLKLQGKSEAEILRLKIKQTDEVIKFREQQLMIQKEMLNGQIEAAKRNREITEGLIKILTLPLTALEKGINIVGKLFGAEKVTLAADLQNAAARLVFDENKTKKEAEASLAENQKAIEGLKNQRAGYVLSLKDIDKKAAQEQQKRDEEAAKRKQENKKKEFEAEFKLVQDNLQRRANAQKEIADDETKTLQERLAALKEYQQLQSQLIEGQKNLELNQLSEEAVRQKEELLKRKLTEKEKAQVFEETANRRKLIEANASAAEIQLAADTQKKVFDIVKQNNEKIKEDNERIQQENLNLQEKIIAYIQKPKQDDVDAAQKYAADVKALNDSLQQKKISIQEYERQRAALEKTHSIESVNSQIETIQKLIDYKKSTGRDTAEDEIALANLQKDLSDQVAEYKIENLKKIQEMERQLAADVLNLIETVVLSGYDKEKNAIEAKKTAIDEQKESEIESINSLAITNEEKAARVTLAEKKAQSEKDKLTRREQEIEVNKARAEKAAALLKIAIETATKVFEIKAQASVLAANPLTAALAPLALSQIPLLLASGAVAAALVAARPIPKFKDGRMDGPATLAIVGDGGKREVVSIPGVGDYLTPDTDTLTYLPAHAKVYPDVERYREVALASSFKTPELIPMENNIAAIQEIANRIEATSGRVVNAIKGIPLRDIHIDENGFKQWVKNGNNLTEYLNKYVKE